MPIRRQDSIFISGIKAMQVGVFFDVVVFECRCCFPADHCCIFLITMHILL